MNGTQFEAIDHSPVFPAKVFVTSIDRSGYHWHYDHELLVMLKGELQASAGPERFILKTNDIILVNSMTVHAYRTLSADNLGLFIQFPGSVLAGENLSDKVWRFLLNSTIHDHPPRFGFRPLIQAACRLGFYSRQSAPSARFRAASALSELIAEIIDGVDRESMQNSGGSNLNNCRDLAVRISDYIDRHIDSTTLNADLKRDFSLGDKAIYRCLKTALDSTLKDLVDTSRIDRAKQLLLRDGTPVVEIAMQSGFISEATFYRIFKRQTGLTPADYRQKQVAMPEQNMIQGYLSYSADEADMLLARLSAFSGALSVRPADRQVNIRSKEEFMQIYQNPSFSHAERAADLVSRMTLEEKIMQLGNNAAAIPRLGLPRYDYWSEASHGFFGPFEINEMDVTSYPVCLAMSQSWDQEKIRQVTRAISDEIRAHHNLNGVELHMWCPTINLARDPRNGRSDENFGEDPFLAGKLAASYIQGLQGAGESDYIKVVSTPKHYALNSSENNRHHGSANVDEATLREYYAKVFEYAIKEGRAQSIMTSYNRINGVPASVNDQLLTTLLREEWGFDGFVVSDCGAVADCYQNPMFAARGNLAHFYCKSLEEASAMTLIAGTDISCGSEHKKAVLKALRLGLISEDIMDRAIIRALLSRFRLGLFDDPGKVPFSGFGREKICSPEQSSLSVSMANDTIVLLKNDNNLLPIDRSKVKNILVVGPNAIYRQLGGYSAGQSPNVDTRVNVMALEGIKNEAAAAGISIRYEKGWLTGKERGLSNVFDTLPGFDRDDVMIDINPGVDGVDQLSVLAGLLGPKDESRKRHIPVDPDYKADENLLFSRALAAAAKADLVIIVAGTDDTTGSEEKDRETLALPYGQDEKIRDLIDVNPDTVVVLVTMGAVTGRFIEQSPALLNAHFAGQAQGEAIANVLFGKVNPNAKLSATWYRSLDDLPHVNDYGLKKQDTYDKKARTYQYFDQPVLFPFGYGLSYTRYEYSNLRIERDSLDANDTLQVFVDVTNKGELAGAEIVQLYISRIMQGKQRDNKPHRQLKAWAKIWLASGETKTVTLTVPLKEMTFWSNLKQKMIVEPGSYRIEAGPSSADLPCRAEFNVTGVWQAELYNVYAVASRYVLAVGEESLISLSATLEDATHLNLQHNSPVFASSDEGVAAVDAQGRITAQKPGAATIACTIAFNGKKQSAHVSVAVKEPV